MSVAHQLTAWEHEVAGDRHLEVRVQDATIAGVDSSAAFDDEAARSSRRSHGVAKVERLAGNVCLVEFTAFYEPRHSGPSIVAAMQLASDSHGLIVDLRRSRGGSPEATALVVTYLFDEAADPIRLSEIIERDPEASKEYWTLPFVPGERFGSRKPVRVLTSRDTFSASEGLAYDLQQVGRAKVVGERSGGGANAGKWFPLDTYLVAFIPMARAHNRISGTNWEGTGVIPDREVEASSALEIADRDILEDLIRSGALDSCLVEESTCALGDLPARSGGPRTGQRPSNRVSRKCRCTGDLPGLGELALGSCV